MRRDWDARARENARHYVATREREKSWTDEEFFRTGARDVEEHILLDRFNIGQGRELTGMRILEIGCGAGRLTRSLASLFGRVDAVDISSEMLALAREALRGAPNAHFHQTSGADLAMFGDAEFDFAFSYIVFQHIPSKAVIESYVREAHRVLKQGALFKFQVQGYRLGTREVDTWNGVGFREEEMQQMAGRCGFEMRYAQGAGTQYFWLWFFKK